MDDSDVLIRFRLLGGEARALRRLSVEELRNPRDQVRHILLGELEKRGLLSPIDPHQARVSESRICSRCGASYGSADLCCPGCGHCFIIGGRHDLAENLQLDILRESVVKS